MLSYKFKNTMFSILIMPCLNTGVSWADEGDLDPTFGDGGLVTTDFLGPNTDFGRDVVAVQADGKTVVVGSTRSLNQTDFAIARYNSDGSLDATFGIDGTVTTDFGSFQDQALAVAIQDDGKIVAAGYSWSGSPNHQDFAIARYNYDGSLDSSFGTGGLVTTDFNFTSELAQAVAIQADGQIVVAGYTNSGGYPTYTDFALVRYNYDGTLDTDFGTGGIVTTHFGYTNDYAFDVAIQANGNIVVVGESNSGYPNYGDFAIARYNPDGSLDNSFGSSGLVVTDFGGSSSAYGVAIQGDDRIVLAGQSNQPGTGFDFSLARYNINGSLDTSFGTGGLVITDFGNSADYAYGVAIQGDGNIVAAGYSHQESTNYDFALARYDTSGNLDSSFGTGGLVITAFTADASSRDAAMGVAIDINGKIVLAGYSDSSHISGYDFALARYDTFGSLDASFGNGGLVTTDFFGSDRDQSWLQVVAVQADGKIVMVGATHSAHSSDFAIARYHPDGSLDMSFGNDGTVTTDFESGYDWPYAVAIQADGKIVVVGESRSGYPTYMDFAMARYNSDGTLDTSFGDAGTGLVTTAISTGNDAASGVLIQPDGKIVLVGWAHNIGSDRYDFALARYNPDGSLDASFDEDGLVTSNFGSDSSGFSVAIQADGKIVAAGEWYASSTTYRDFALVRYNINGSLDTSFGSGGLVNTDFSSAYDSGSSVVVQPDGKIVVAGYSHQGATNIDFALARYDTNGNLDATFGTGGLVVTDFAGSRDYGYGVALQADGRIVVVGTSFQPSTSYDFAVARYDMNGNLDTTFGASGLVTTDFAGIDDFAYAVVIQADGKILVAGDSDSGSSSTGRDLAMARYEGLADPNTLVELLIVEVQYLVSLDVVNNGQGNSLLVKLQGALQQLDAQQTGSAINKLEAFINQVNAFVEAEILTPTEGETYIDAANLIIEVLML